MIRPLIHAAIVVAGLASLPNLVQGQTAAATFERLKSLVGEWETVAPGGERIRVEYQLVSGGTAVLERVVGPAEHGPAGMLSIYYLDGSRVGMSHFCSAANRPRFGSTSAGDTVRFALVAGSLADSMAGHIHQVEFRFGGGRLETEWVWYQQGRREHVLVRRQVRVRS